MRVGYQFNHRWTQRAVLGCAICFYIWLNLRWPAKLLGGSWLLAGLLWGACRKGGFRMMRDVK